MEKNIYNSVPKEKKISIAVIRRLPRYYRYLGDLLDNGVTRVSSNELSLKMNVTASQIRQDLNNFGCFGQQGYGYNVQLLYDEIKKILGLTKEYRIIIIGAGNLGQALVNYQNFSKRGFRFTCMFDVNDALVGQKIGGVEVRHIRELSTYLDNSEDIDIAALTLPRSGANDIADILFSHNVKGIWNFSHTDLTPPEGVYVENVHLTDSLMILSYQLGEENI